MRYLIAMLFSLLLAGPVMAHMCPSLVHKIDSQLESHQLDSEAKMEIVALRDQGADLHKQGKHDESVKVLNEALEKLANAM